MTTGAPSPDKLSIVIHSDDFGKIHYALVLAAAAVAVGRAVTLFFTMAGARALLAKRPDGTPGWAALSGNPADRDKAFADSGVATFEELLTSCAELGARIMVCDMGLKAEGIAPNSLRTDIEIQISGAVTFLGDASKDGAILFV